MTAPNVNPDPGLYDEAEWEMLAAMENEDPRPPAGADVREARRRRWRQAFRDAAPAAMSGRLHTTFPIPGDRSRQRRATGRAPRAIMPLRPKEKRASWTTSEPQP